MLQDGTRQRKDGVAGFFFGESGGTGYSPLRYAKSSLRQATLSWGVL